MFKTLHLCLLLLHQRLPQFWPASQSANSCSHAAATSWAAPRLLKICLRSLLQFGATKPPQLIFKGERLQLVSVLGRGATATVYGCKGCDQKLLAAKVLDTPAPATGEAAGPAANEVAMLQHLKDCSGIVQLVGELDDGRGFLLEPVGTALARLREALQTKRLYKGIEGLISTIRSVHGKGIVHRDLRSSNLLAVQDNDRPAVLIMDW